MSQISSRMTDTNVNEGMHPQTSLSQQMGSGFAGQQQMGEVGQKLDKQNFIETLQLQAQPIGISPAPLSGLPASFAEQSLSNSGVASSPSMTTYTPAGSSETTLTNSNVFGRDQQTAPVSTTVLNPSAITSNSFAFTSSTCAAPTVATASPLITSFGQPTTVVDPIAMQNQVFPGPQYPRRMVHQQSWSEGTFENMLQPSVGQMPGSGPVATASGIAHQFNRRRSMEQIAGLPQDYGMNSVIEPLHFKIPAAAGNEAEAADRKADCVQTERRTKSPPPREYSCPVSQTCDPLPPVVSVPFRDSPPATVTSPLVPSPEAAQVTECLVIDPPVDVPAPSVTTNDPVTDPLVVDVVVSPVHVTSHEPVVTGPVRVVAQSPPEAWVNPFSKLLKSFDDDVHDECSLPPLVSSVTVPNSSDPSGSPSRVPADVVPVSSPPANHEKRSSLTNEPSGTSRDHPPSRSNQTKSSPTSTTADTLTTVMQKGSPAEGTTAGRVDERRSSMGSISANYKARTGALLPTIPNQNRAVPSTREDRFCVRTGSLSEQEFVQQLSSVRNDGFSPDTGCKISDTSKDMSDNLNFEVDEDYENEGELDDEDEDEDEQVGGGVTDMFTCDTIVEESEEESMSPRSFNNFTYKKQVPSNESKALSSSSAAYTAPATTTSAAGPISWQAGSPRGSVTSDYRPHIVSLVCLSMIRLSTAVLCLVYRVVACFQC